MTVASGKKTFAQIKALCVMKAGGFGMSLSVDSKVKELMNHPAAADLLETYSPGFKTNPQMKMVQGLTFRKLASFPQAGLSAEKVEEIDKALKALE